MKKRKALSKKVRFEVFKRDSFTCQYCGKSPPQIILHCDHINPVSQGGTNDLLNLITSCVDCNQGKGARKLKNDSIVSKQMNQLKLLNERRQQLEMIAQWKSQTLDSTQQATDLFVAHLHKYYGVSLNEYGIQYAKKTIRRFGLEETLDATEKSAHSYLHDVEDQEDRDRFLNQIPKICYWAKREKTHPEQAEISKLCGYASKRWSTFYRPSLWSKLQNLYNQGVPVETLWDAMFNSTGIMRFEANLENALRDQVGD